MHILSKRGLFFLIAVAILVGIPVNATKLYEVSYNVAPAPEGEYILLGVGNYNNGRYAEAIRSFDLAISINPNNANAWFDRGAALDQLGRYEEALESYNKVLTIDPTAKSQVQVARGNVFYHLGRYEDALVSYNQTGEWYNKGNTFAKLGRDIEALESYDKFLAINGNRTIPLDYGTFSGDYRVTNYQGKLSQNNSNIILNQNLAGAWSNRGNMLYHLGRYSEAVKSYDNALAFFQDDTQTLENRKLAQNQLALEKSKTVNPTSVVPTTVKSTLKISMTVTDKTVIRIREEPIPQIPPTTKAPLSYAPFGIIAIITAFAISRMQK